MTMRARLAENLGLKVLALLLALLLWLFVTGAREDEVAVTAPVRYRHLAPQLAVVSQGPSSIALRIAGPKGRLLRLCRENLLVTLDLQGVGEGSVTFSDLGRAVALPDGLRVIRAYPSSIEVRVARTGT